MQLIHFSMYAQQLFSISNQHASCLSSCLQPRHLQTHFDEHRVGHPVQLSHDPPRRWCVLPKVCNPILFHIAQQNPHGTISRVQNILLFTPAATAF
jgi:hypothetical protein